MHLTVEYLRERHKYWANILKEKNIFPGKIDSSIKFEIKYARKSHYGMYHHSGKIVIYPPIVDIDQEFVDNILVHEMIHQYIHENKIYDKSSHGPQFRYYMSLINYKIPEITITITYSTAKYKSTEEGYETFKLLYLKYVDNSYSLCSINPNKVYEINLKILNRKFNFKKQLIGFCWMESKNKYFKDLRKCQTNLSGYHFYEYQNPIKQTMEKYNIKKIELIEEL